MPILDHGPWQIDYAAEGSGPVVVLIHSSVSGNRQWRRLAQALSADFHVLAPNLFGYGGTTGWTGPKPQRLSDQAMLVEAVLGGRARGPIHLVGHSFGGAVALEVARRLGGAVQKLVLLDPNPFHLLEQGGRSEAYAEILELRDHVRRSAESGAWPEAAARFADYWLGPGTFAAMPDQRRDAFVRALRPNYREWDAVIDETTSLEAWAAVPARTLLLVGERSPRPIREIAQLLRDACPGWSLVELPGAMHMAPLTDPDRVNPLILDFLRSP